MNEDSLVSGLRPVKYLEIVDRLRSSLMAGSYSPGSRLPSEAELTRRFGVSRMTVVKAIQVLTQEGLVTRRAGSGTFAAIPEIAGRQTFGLLIPDLGQTEIFEPICRGMMLSHSSSGCSLSWGQGLSSGPDAEREMMALCQQFIGQRIGGVFFAPLEFAHQQDVNQRVVDMLDEAKIPVVLLDRDYVQFPVRGSHDLVSLDNRRAGYVVTSHLIAQGGRRIGFFARPNSAETVEHRIVGFREALHDHGLPISDEFVIRGDATNHDFVSNTLRRTKVDSIMCANDHTAADLMQTLLAINVEIPSQIRLAGVDDVRYARLLPVPLTTFHQPCADLGMASMSAMLDRIQNPTLPARTITLNGNLVIRQSSVLPATP